MNIKVFSILSFVIIALSISCTSEKEKTIQQNENFWIDLSVEDAKSVEENKSWDFILSRPGKYNVQIICEGEVDSPLPEITIESDGNNLIESPGKILVIGRDGAKQTIFQFNGNVVYNETGLKTLIIKTESPFARVRITPIYSNTLGFGSKKYDAEWQEMHNSPEKQATLAWFKEAKYGMFIHWGLYSQAGGIWKGVRMEDSENPGPGVSEWLMYKFQIPRNEYAELAKTFNPDKTFAQNIVKLAKDAGMKYVVITSKHHDGFALFDSKCSEYDIVDTTPYNADVIKALYEACLAEGLDFGVYYSHGNDWYDGADGNYANVKKVNDSLGILTHAPGKNLWDPSPNTHAEYIENKALPQIRELLQAMPKLRLIWFDGDGYITEEQAFQFYKTVFELNPNVIVNRRVGFDFGDYLDAGDNVIPSAENEMTKYWETCGTTNNSWAFKSYDNDWKSTQEMLYYLVDIASKGGNYLLNIGPDGFGRVPEQSANGLRELGEWLTVNGDAIYGSTRWNITKEGQEETLLEGTGHRANKGFARSFSANDFWFTSKDNKVYVISLITAQNEIKIKSIKTTNANVKEVRLLGNESKINWEQTPDELKVDLNGLDTGKNGFVLEVTLIN